MRKLFILLFIFCFVPSAFAAPATIQRFGFTPVTKTDEDLTTGVETDTLVWDPDVGKHIVLMGVMFWSDTKTNCFVETGSTKVIPNFTTDTASGITVIGNGVPIWRGSADAQLTYTTDINSAHSILMWGYED